MQAALEGRLQASQQQAKTLQADLAKAELRLENAASDKSKLPFFPMSPLTTPPVRHGSPSASMDNDKENVSGGSARRHGKSHAQVRLAHLCMFKC